jgi:hypothetical protein
VIRFYLHSHWGAMRDAYLPVLTAGNNRTTNIIKIGGDGLVEADVVSKHWSVRIRAMVYSMMLIFRAASCDLPGA